MQVYNCLTILHLSSYVEFDQMIISGSWVLIFYRGMLPYFKMYYDTYCYIFNEYFNDLSSYFIDFIRWIFMQNNYDE